jgi:hypothetical protein
MKVPTIIATAVICFALGVGVSVGAMLVAFPEIYKPKSEGDAGMPDPRMAGGGGPQGMMPMGGGPGGPGGGGPGGAGGGPGGTGRGAPNSKVLLARLISKLEVLTQKPLIIQLDDDKQKKLAEQLKGLEGMDELSEEEAKNRLEAILALVKEDKETLKAAGYQWPGEAPAGGAGGGLGGGRPADVPNPFKEGDNNKHLKSLQDVLAKGKAG